MVLDGEEEMNTHCVPVVDRNMWVAMPADLQVGLPDYFERLEVDGVLLARCSDGRFMEDRCLTVNHRYAFLIDGIILNKAELFGATGCSTVPELFESLVAERGADGALASLRGVFSGVILDRQSRMAYTFGNQTGESAAFAHAGTAPWIISSGFDLIMRLLKQAGVSTTFDEHGAQVMLSYGFMIDNHTFAEEIKRVSPGAVLSLRLNDGDAREVAYWRLRVDRPCEAATMEEAVERVDQLFRQAVARCFDKDLEYGYERHLVDISGGMDARMVNVVAKDLGYDRITNITYGQSTSDERRYSVRLAVQLGNDHLFHSMDGGRAAVHPEDNLRLNSGMAFYSGITGGKFMLGSLNFDTFGLEHTGQLGGAVIGTYATSADRRAPAAGAGAYSKINTYPKRIEADDEELFMMNTRAFRGSTSTHLLRQHFTFAVSPYSDVDLLDFVFSLPVEWRMGHKLFSLWAKSCYPASLIVPTTRFLPAAVSPVRNGSLFVRKATGVLSRGVLNRMRSRNLPGKGVLTRLSYSMNPLESWYEQNAEFRNLIETSQERARALPGSLGFTESLMRAFGESATMDDMVMGVTVVAMYDMYFSGPLRGSTS